MWLKHALQQHLDLLLQGVLYSPPLFPSLNVAKQVFPIPEHEYHAL